MCYVITYLRNYLTSPLSVIILINYDTVITVTEQNSTSRPCLCTVTPSDEHLIVITNQLHICGNLLEQSPENNNYDFTGVCLLQLVHNHRRALVDFKH